METAIKQPLNKPSNKVKVRFDFKPQHFTKEEFLSFGGNEYTWFYAKPLLDIPITILQSRILNEKDFLKDLANNKNESKAFYSYIRRLAFFERIELSLEFVIKHNNFWPSNFPISDTPNFQVFFNLVDKHITKLFNELELNEKTKKGFIKAWLQIILKLWLAGYGVLPGYGRRMIDNEALEAVFRRQGKTIWNGPRSTRLLAKLLEQEPESPVNKPAIDKHRGVDDIFELARNIWDSLLEQNQENEIVLYLHKYIFGELRERTEGQLIREFTEPSTGKKRNEALSPLSPQSFRRMVSSLRKYIQEYVSEYSITDLLTEEVFRKQLSLMYEIENNSFRSVIRGWLDWLIKVEGFNVDLTKLMPIRRRRRSDRVHGKILNPVAVATFIDHLLNQPANLIFEDRIIDYRCRRLCLIMLSTGSRLSQTLCSKYDCIETDKFGNKLIVFHSVKGDKPYTGWCDDELLSWIEELRMYAPKEPLYFSAAANSLAGDNLNTMRLFANSADDGPLGRALVQTWLKAFQEKIWSNKEHPNDSYFSPHDLRRMQATYLTICGFSKEAIQVKLGHSNINSQIPYTATGDPRNADDYALILEGDIYNLDTGEIDPNHEIKISQQTHNADTSSAEIITEHWLDILTKTLEMTNDDTITSGNDVFAPTLVATGYPLFLAHCGSPGHYGCGSSPIYCLSCKEHNVDKQKETDYKALLLRQMVSCLHHEYLAKRHKLTGYRDAYYEKVDGDDGLKKTIDNALKNVFVNGLNFSTSEAGKIQSNLWKLAKQWYNAHLKDSEPILEQNEAISIIRAKEVL